ncbi:MAG TPA: SLC13 family permease [Clostridia bacterium]|nr:SLC13 family permease [Clostridia bacterium]HOL60277.1 SLC13 family permease [Clostridia bacterium]HPO53810.1 SLC13 family permease [Clostridia bacterium]
MAKVIKFAEKNIVVLIAWLLAAVSMILVPPDPLYKGYFDLPTLCCLFSTMLVIGAFKSRRFFITVAKVLILKLKNARLLCISLVFITFAASVFLANDMALLTFLPLTIMVYKSCGKEKHIAFTIIMQTVSANLGGMIMPFGNPQSLYLYSAFNIEVSEFVRIMAIPFLISVVVIFGLCFAVKSEKVSLLSDEKAQIPPWRVALYTALFALSLLAVFRVVNYLIVTAAIAVVLLAVEYKSYTFVDYGLLLTFTAFFIFANNMSRLDEVRQAVAFLLDNSVYLTGIISCQFFSNVPSAIFLSKFTSDYRQLLLATNIGGCGTLIASLASLISFKAYTGMYPDKGLKYLGLFSLINFGFLVALSAVVMLLII